MKKTMNVRTLTFIAMMGAVSTVLMMLNFSIPFAPSFLKETLIKCACSVWQNLSAQECVAKA